MQKITYSFREAIIKYVLVERERLRRLGFVSGDANEAKYVPNDAQILEVVNLSDEESVEVWNRVGKHLHEMNETYDALRKLLKSNQVS